MNEPAAAKVTQVKFKSGGEIRSSFKDALGNQLDLVTEFHGPYRKFFAEYRKVGDPEVAVSTPMCWQGDSDLDQLHEKKVNESLAAGWTKI